MQKFICCGIHVSSTPIEIRERLMLGAAQLNMLYKGTSHFQVWLNTCARAELFVYDIDEETIKAEFARSCCVAPQALAQYLYVYTGKEALIHLLRMACGLDSVNLGEHHILGQIKRAYQYALEQQSQDDGAAKSLQMLFRYVIAHAKKIRHQTAITSYANDMTAWCMRIAKQVFTTPSSKKILLVGSGEMIQEIAQALLLSGQDLLFVSRTFNEGLGWPLSLWRPMSRIEEALQQSDIVITATAASTPLIGKGVLESVMIQRRYHPLVLFDLAVPRDVEPQAQSIDHLYLYNIDQIHEIIRLHRENHDDVTQKAEAAVVSVVDDFEYHWRSFYLKPWIMSYRQEIEAYTHKMLAQGKTEFSSEKETQIFERYFHAFSQHMLHISTLKIKEALLDDRQHTKLEDDDEVNVSRVLAEAEVC